MKVYLYEEEPGKVPFPFMEKEVEKPAAIAKEIGGEEASSSSEDGDE